MSKKRKQYSAEFKAKVALAAIKGDQTTPELAARFQIHTTMVSNWKRELLERAGKLFEGKVDIISNKIDQQRFAKYVESHVALKTLSGETLKLNSVGAQVDGKFFWVYQEAAIPKGIEGIKMSNGALRDLWPSQVNMVNVEGKGKIKTLNFSQDDTWLEARFEQN